MVTVAQKQMSGVPASLSSRWLQVLLSFWAHACVAPLTQLVIPAMQVPILQCLTYPRYAGSIEAYAGLRPFHYKPQDNAATIMQRAASQEHVDRLFSMLELNGASEDLVDLLKHMLVINPSARYNMCQVLPPYPTCTSPCHMCPAQDTQSTVLTCFAPHITVLLWLHPIMHAVDSSLPDCSGALWTLIAVEDGAHAVVEASME